MTDNDIAVLLARVDERTKAMHSLLKEHVTNDEMKHKDFENRIRKNEKFKWYLLGGGGITAAGLTGFIQGFFG